MKEVLITGATRGIGRACMEEFLRHGWSVTAVARSVSELMPRADVEAITAVAADLATEEGVAAIPQRPYSVVILNAAMYAPGSLLGGGGLYETLMPLNVLANYRLARRFVPPMVAQGCGHLVVIGSSGTDHFKSHMTAYVATKYALRGLFLGWQEELALTQVKCVLIAPGATLTSSWDGEEAPVDILQPEDVAVAVWRAVQEGAGGRVAIS